MKALYSLLMLLIMATLILLGVWYFRVFSQGKDFKQKVRLLVSKAEQKDNDFQQTVQSFEENLSLKEGSTEYFERYLLEVNELIYFNNDLIKRTSLLVVPKNGHLIYEKLVKAWEARGRALSDYQDFIKLNKEAFFCYQRSKACGKVLEDKGEKYLQSAIEADIEADKAMHEAHSWEEKAQKQKAAEVNNYTKYLNIIQDAKWQIEKSLL